MINFPKFKYSKPIFWLLIGILIALLLSCSPVKRLERLHKNHPYLFTAKTDTLIVKDTLRFMIPGVRADTVVSYAQLTDTLYIDKDRLHIRIVRIPMHDSIYVDGRCDTVYKTVYREIKVPYQKYEVKPPAEKNNWRTVINIFLVIFVLFLIYLLYRYLSAE
ncbi:MAG TPA: hypothetical protein PLP27_10905 [Crocinitomicaceae bacterium]|nr:hypothetical protein [Crocinitomicaceae bacterium]